MAIQANNDLLGYDFIDPITWGGYWDTSTSVGGPVGTITYSIDKYGVLALPFYSYEVTAINSAFQAWSNVVNFESTEVDLLNPGSDYLENFTYAMMPDISGAVGMHETPDPTQPGSILGSYNTLLGIFNASHSIISEASLQPGGHGFKVVLHEIGHGLGFAHPHDNGGKSTLMAGVNSSSDIGNYYQNQGVFTTMSYNSGYPQYYNPSTNSYGYEMTPMALDVYLAQSLYGANTNHNSGNNVYSLPLVNTTGTGWQCIWDTSGVDWISGYGSTLPVILDLRPASITGNAPGGYVSNANGIYGGFTIAYGAQIENAVGGDANDYLVDNTLNNFLSGGKGNDTIFCLAGGSDVVEGDLGNNRDYYDQQVYRMYKGVLGREPDAGGHGYWTNELTAGRLTLLELASSFQTSTEYVNNFSSRSNSDFIEALYVNVLGRASDADGKAYWLYQIENGFMTKSEVILGFTESLEFINSSQYDAQKWNSSGVSVEYFDDIMRLYKATLDRLPDEDGLLDWSRAVGLGYSFETIATGFIESDEFLSRFGVLDNQDFITKLYENVLGRAPDDSGLADWLRAFDLGYSRADVVLGFSNSPEFISNTQSNNKAWLDNYGTYNDSVYLDNAASVELFLGLGADNIVIRTVDQLNVTIYDFEYFDDLIFYNDNDYSSTDFGELLVDSGYDAVLEIDNTRITFKTITSEQLSAFNNIYTISGSAYSAGGTFDTKDHETFLEELGHVHLEHVEHDFTCAYEIGIA